MRTPTLIPLLLVTGCLSLGEAEAPVVRTLRPPIAAQLPPRPPSVPKAVPLRLLAVRAAPHLTDKIAWQQGGIEIGTYEHLRWSASPAELVELVLDRELFYARGYQRSEALRTRTAAVDVLAFEEVLDEPRGALVQLALRLEDPVTGTIVERTFESRVPSAGDTPEALARAMSDALQQAVAQVADAIGG